jgi:hypothetical protein
MGCQILIWSNASPNITSIILANLTDPWSVFVTSDDEIFVDNKSLNNRVVERRILNKTQRVPPMSICSRCTVLFVDINNNLYCSKDDRHQDLKKSLNDPTNAPVTIAETGCPRSASHMLH